MMSIEQFPSWSKRSYKSAPAPALLRSGIPHRGHDIRMELREQGWGWWLVRPHDNCHCIGRPHAGLPYMAAVAEAKRHADAYLDRQRDLMRMA